MLTGDGRTVVFIDEGGNLTAFGTDLLMPRWTQAVQPDPLTTLDIHSGVGAGGGGGGAAGAPL
ncbi:MAG: hypothetical protein HC915_12435 [Anaerolineae bacterium]|nr:hypothetical protein [Anaerolineae bacterium]